MNFNSADYLFFLPAVVVLAFLLRGRERSGHLMLLVASYMFYGSWNWRYAGLMLLSTVLDYFIAQAMDRQERPGRRKALLGLSLGFNLGMLGVFKYYNFFVDSTTDLAAALGLNFDLPHHRLLLPVGISFYTFQTLSYTIDVYRRDLPPERSLLRFALFVSFFPQLVAGPIVRAADFLPQLHREPVMNRARFNVGLARVFQGLLKKVILADLLSTLGVDAVFADPASYSSLDLLLALYGYSFQIYCDFSGYSDIAIGSAHMLGYDLTENFNRPYLAQNVREFWARWHISLSTWLRDYLYIPLGGNRGKPLRVRFNLLATMVLGGLWHGAALNFVLWGLWHGVLLTFNRKAAKHDPDARGWTLWRRRFLCFHLVVFSWLLFRVQDTPGGPTATQSLGLYLKGLLQFEGGTRLHGAYFAVLALAFLAHLAPRPSLERLRERWAIAPSPVQGFAYACLLVLLCAATLGAPSFIYFQF